MPCHDDLPTYPPSYCSQRAIISLPNSFYLPTYLPTYLQPSTPQAEAQAFNQSSDAFMARTATNLNSFTTYNQYLSGTASIPSKANLTAIEDMMAQFDFSFSFKVGR